MSIFFKHNDSIREIEATYFKKENILRTVTTVYKKINGTVVAVWEYIKSCFGKGFWVGEQPWSGTDGWNTL